MMMKFLKGRGKQTIGIFTSISFSVFHSHLKAKKSKDLGHELGQELYMFVWNLSLKNYFFLEEFFNLFCFTIKNFFLFLEIILYI